ncbi:ribonuclease HIII [Convivina praedatoris]|uniref:Ribonuclease HIII n=1 Tax=Convivina praedatoris TaxID=2880963 RepID=A0ABM9D2X4_9LACO|nr:ribonuclease HIII [Convivina sp. LMG 32447]CAH1852710.1 Ribonuclease HIII [Convivina sp. LMG 32447]CAH1852748.1 Ribonuclease HIII [Convivina sp. LMG 32447]CAH1854819.1 Ribonuclease HIII [Convivina sp. LMG 32447]
MQIVIQLPQAQIKKIQQYYQTQVVSKGPAGSIFRAKTANTTVTAYRSGKVLFQGNQPEIEAQKWQKIPDSTSRKKNIHAAQLPSDFHSWSVIGSDEVGAGAYFGPLTTAAVYVSHTDLDWVKNLGIADSKTLTDDKMRTIAPQIIERLPHHVVNLMPDQYNKLQKKYNVVALKALSHNFALSQVIQKIAPNYPQGILIDQFVQAKSYFAYLEKAQQRPIIRRNVFFSTKGEQHHLSVAAASILARVIELEAMEQLSQEAGLSLTIGAGSNVDQLAARLLSRKMDLGHFAKLHFANTQKAQQLLK